MGSYWRRRNWHQSVRPENNSLTLQKAVHQLDIQTFLMGSRPARVFATGAEDHYGGDFPSEHTCGLCAQAEACQYDARKMQINGRPAGQAVQDGLCVYSDDTQLHDNQVVAIDYADGARGSYVECFFTPDYKIEHTIIGDRGRLEIRAGVDDETHQLTVSWIGTTQQRVTHHDATGGHGGGDTHLGEAFMRALKTQSPIQPDILDGYYAVALARGIDQSVDTGQLRDIEHFADAVPA